MTSVPTTTPRTKNNSGQMNNNNGMVISIEKILNDYGKKLNPGDSISFTLVKGKETSTSVDPLLARRTNKGNTNNNSKYELKFPRVAKFAETVTKPDFEKEWKDGRWYEEDIPKAMQDSDEENDESEKNKKRKKRRWRRQEGPKQQWILQPRTEFVEKWRMKQAKKRKLSTSPEEAALMEAAFLSKISQRYHGLPENNPSSYITLQLEKDTNSHPAVEHLVDRKTGTKKIKVQRRVEVTSMQGFHNFTQPQKFATLSMTDAQNAIENQRMNMTRYMMHAKGASNTTSSAAGQQKIKMTQAKARLLGKLLKPSNNEDEDEDDLMADLTFTDSSSKKGRTISARKELLSSLGDEGITVDDDGVLGGANDAEFGGRRRFGKLAISRKSDNKSDQSTNKNNTTKGSSKGDHVSKAGGGGNDGLAMEEDFYQRDVQAEYEDLDFDANEQFDDDDVDVGAEEINDQLNTGFGIPDVDDDDFDSDDDDDDDGLQPDQLAALANAANSQDNNSTTPSMGDSNGFGSKKGFNIMLAKARGETLPDLATAAAIAAAQKAAAVANTSSVQDKNKATNGTDSHDNDKSNSSDDPNKSDLGSVDGNLSGNNGSKGNTNGDKNSSDNKSKINSGDNLTGVEVDEHGQRIISLEAVRREIWLHHGSIRMKRLLKIFDIKKKTSADRQSKFREVVRELCTMTQDKVEGNLLVLKQHYSNMG